MIQDTIQRNTDHTEGPLVVFKTTSDDFRPTAGYYGRRRIDEETNTKHTTPTR